MKPGDIDRGIESVRHYKYRTLLRSIDLMLNYFLGSITREFPRYQAEMDPEQWEHLEAAVKFMENLRGEIKEEFRRQK